MDHFSGMPLIQKMKRTTAKEVVGQLKTWFATFGVARFFKADNGPPFTSKDFSYFCKDFCIKVNLTAPYHPQSSGVGLVNEIMKSTEGIASF